MRNVVCPNCNQELAVPDDLTEAHCVRCGQTLSLTDTRMTAVPVALHPSSESEWTPGSTRPLEPPATYADWSEFRSLSPSVQRAWADLATTALPDLRNVERQPLPANLPPIADALGQPLASLSTPGDNRFLIHFLSFVIISIGMFAALFTVNAHIRDQKKEIAETVVGAAFYLFGGMALGAWISFWRDPNYAVDYWILERGILWQRAGGIEGSGWADIESLEIDHHRGLLCLALELRPGIRVTIRSSGRPELMPLLEYIITSTTAAQFLPRLRRIFDGENVAFGAVHLNRAGFTHGRFFAPWTEIAKVVVDPARLFVDCRNRAQWYAVPYRYVSFPHLVVVLSHVLIEEHTRLPDVNA